MLKQVQHDEGLASEKPSPVHRKGPSEGLLLRSALSYTATRNQTRLPETPMIDRRHFIGQAGLGLAFLAACRTGAEAQTPASPEQARLTTLFDRMFEDTLRISPESATYLGVDKGPRAALKAKLGLTDYANRTSGYALFVKAAPQLAAIDRAKLTETSQIHLDTARWFADVSKRVVSTPYGGTGNGYPVPYVVSQLSGSYVDTPSLLTDRHSLESRADAEAFLSRLTALARNIDFETERVRADEARGIVPPTYIVDKTLAQLRAFAGERGAQSRFVKTMASANLEGDWTARVQRMVEGPLAAALQRQIAAVEALKPKSGMVPGAGRLPGGEEFYATCLRFHTTTPMTPAEAHRIGREQLAALTADADTLLRARGLTTGTVGARLRALGEDASLQYPNTDAGRTQVIADLNKRVTELRAMMSRIFSDQPRSGMEVRRVPVARELGAPGAYASSGALDGSTPGIFYINLKDMSAWPKWALPTLIHHEAVPGHLWEGAIAAQYGDAPDLFQTIGFTAHGEGWGLYAEQLADEIGVYEGDPLGKLGLLQSFLFRAARIVVDTGMHAMGWSREQAIQVMGDATGNPAADTEREIDRYIVWPAQATAYKIGHSEMVRIREAAKARLGDKFTLKGFNDLVIRGGGMPLEVLDRRVQAWQPS